MENIRPQAERICQWQELTDRLNTHPSALVVLNTRKDALKVIKSLNSLPVEYFEAVGLES